MVHVIAVMVLGIAGWFAFWVWFVAVVIAKWSTMFLDLVFCGY